MQLNASVVPVPSAVHAPEHPAHVAHAWLSHCVFAVHQQATPDALHVPDDDATLLQLPGVHDSGVLATGVAGSSAVEQFISSAGSAPVHGPWAVHWLCVASLTHFPPSVQLVSAVHKQNVCAVFVTVPVGQLYVVVPVGDAGGSVTALQLMLSRFELVPEHEPEGLQVEAL
jgi:hypothetical protein